MTRETLDLAGPAVTAKFWGTYVIGGERRELAAFAAQRGFPEAMRDVGGWRFTMALQGVDDLAAIMEPGLSALLAAHASGADAPAAAQALWEEFQSARNALMGLVLPV